MNFVNRLVKTKMKSTPGVNREVDILMVVFSLTLDCQELNYKNSP